MIPLGFCKFPWNRACQWPVRAIIALLAFSLAGETLAAAVGGSADAAPPATLAIQQSTPASMSAFADEILPRAMHEGKIPGAVITVVSGDQVILQKAYGVAEIQSERPVSARETLFRVASVSKIFTAASVLQLAREHLLDLHRNVNSYLTHLHIAPAFNQPITLHNLLTHSSGFDYCRFDYAAPTRAQKLMLRDYLVEFQPARVRPPGRLSVYDNYGYALAGYLVQKISGVPFAEYVREQLLTPLKMNHSSFSPEPALRHELANGYWLDDETVRACRPDYINITPAAGLCTTAADMGHFLIALVANRRADGQAFFSQQELAELETPQFAANPKVPGWCYGFNQVTVAGRRVLRQTGDWPGFNSVVLLSPRQHCGLFLAYNLNDGCAMADEVARAFVQRFVPAQPAHSDNQTVSLPGDSLAALCGSYQTLRFPKEAPELDLPRELEVTQSADQQLEIGGQPYREIAPLVFERVTGSSLRGKRVAFRLGRDGNVTHLITEGSAYRRASWLQSDAARAFLVRAVSGVFLSALIFWPLLGLLRLIAPQPENQVFHSRRSKWFSRAARATAFTACALALWIEVSLALAQLRLGPFADLYGFPEAIRNCLNVLPLLMVLAVALGMFCVIAWRKQLWNLPHRLHYTLLTAALAIFFFIFYSRHLLFVN